MIFFPFLSPPSHHPPLQPTPVPSFSERYSEHLSPVLVQAQRKLVSRVNAYGGPPPEQPHFRISARANGGESITAENYMFKQLRVQVNTAMLPPIETGGRIDPEGHNVYEGKETFH